MITRFSELIDEVLQSEPAKVAVAAAQDDAVLMACQVEVVTPQCSVGKASEAFDEDGQFREERLRHQMEKVCRSLIERAAMMSTRVEP